MTVNGIDVEATVRKLQALLVKEKDISPALSTTLETLLMVVQLLANRLTLNSRNSSKPPSSDKNRTREKRSSEDKRKAGGQSGSIGTTLRQLDDPDEIETLTIDRSALPPGEYREAGFERRQVFDIDISRVVTEYRAQVVINENGQRFVAPFPDHVTKAVQYGAGVKAHAVYLSQYQLIPYQRVQEYFQDQLKLPISAGSIYNFNQQAFALLGEFEQRLVDHLVAAPLLHTDETSVNIDGKLHWLHCHSNERWTLFYAQTRRGTDAMNEKNVLPRFKGVLCHDHWKPYYKYTGCEHALCNAHHLRELERAYEQDGQQWAKQFQELLNGILTDVKQQGGSLSAEQAKHYTERYRNLLRQAEIECPPPDEKKNPKQRGRTKRSKARNLLERLQLYEQDVLRFMTNPIVPFTNNQGENDLRMTKVHQKISGCFRSKDGADIFCRVRSFLSTCRKNSLSASEALTLLFAGKLPDFL
ncbi:MAG: IS66 family transposase [Burkholderiales bacterium]|nr:IS66 family transposase [Burkholderiales bacterium]